jgi:hypothetical protein
VIRSRSSLLIRIPLLTRTKGRFGSLLVAGGASVAVLSGAAQRPAPQHSITVIVFNALAQPPQPVKAVRVSLGYLDSGVAITDAQQVTNSQGEALLEVSADASQRGNLRIQITGASDLVIYQPADGQLAELPSRLQISLLPKGSAALLGPAQLEAMLHRTLLRVNSLQQQNRQLSSQVAEAQKPDPALALAEWAQANGFPPDVVNEAVHKWAESIQSQSAQSSAEQLALAEFALKHYSAAAQAFDAAADSSHEEIDATEAEAAALEKALADKVRDKLRQLINDREQASGAYEIDSKWHEGTQTLEAAAGVAASEYKKHPGDREFHELWLETLAKAALARDMEASEAPRGQIYDLIVQSANDYRLLSNEYRSLGDLTDFATMQYRFASRAALEAQAAARADAVISCSEMANPGVYSRFQLERTSEKADAFFGQAVQAQKEALGAYDRNQNPGDWAWAQKDLGWVLMAEGNFAGAKNAPDILAQAAAADRAAATAFAKLGQKAQAADAQAALGKVLSYAAQCSAGENSAPLFDQAVQAYGAALTVDVGTDDPFAFDWELAQNDLETLQLIIEFQGPAQKAGTTPIFDRIAEIERNELKAFPEERFPERWTSIQTDLAETLLTEEEDTDTANGPLLFSQALQAYRSALEVDSQAADPKARAQLQIDIVKTDMMANRFADCLHQAAAIASGPASIIDGLSDSQILALGVMKFACQWGSGDKNSALTTEKSLLANLPKPSGGFIDTGDLNFPLNFRFIHDSPAFQSGRSSWLGLFRALQTGEVPEVAAALHELEPVMQQ